MILAREAVAVYWEGAGLAVEGLDTEMMATAMKEERVERVEATWAEEVAVTAVATEMKRGVGSEGRQTSPVPPRLRR